MDRTHNAGAGAAAFLALMLLALAAPAAAQIPWESPLLVSPAAPGGLGLFVADWGLGPGDGVGLLLTWRGPDGPGAGLRAGAARDADDQVMVVGGIDYSLPVFRRTADFPLDVIWTIGAGASYGDYLKVGVPVGLVAGRAMENGTLWLNPYLSGRVAFDASLGPVRPEEAFGIGLAVDIGADVAFGRGRNFILRIGTSLGDRHAAVAGLHVRM